MRRLLLMICLIATGCSAVDESNANRCNDGYRPVASSDWRRGDPIYAGPNEVYGTIADLRHSHTFGDGRRGMAVGIRFSDHSISYFPPSALADLGYLVAC